MRVMPGAKITDTMASPISNTTTMNTVRARGESPLRAAVFARGTVPRNLPIRAGGAGLPIVSA